jgi:hypothetical protein
MRRVKGCDAADQIIARGLHVSGRLQNRRIKKGRIGQRTLTDRGRRGFVFTVSRGLGSTQPSVQTRSNAGQREWLGDEVRHAACAP